MFLKLCAGRDRSPRAVLASTNPMRRVKASSPPARSRRALSSSCSGPGRCHASKCGLGRLRTYRHPWSGLVHGRARGSSPAVRRWSTPSRASRSKPHHVLPRRLRDLLVAEAELGERIMRALILRRVALLGDRRRRAGDRRQCRQRRRPAARRVPRPQRPPAPASRPEHRSVRANADRALSYRTG